MKLNVVSIVCKDPYVIQLSYGMEQANTFILISKNRRAIVIDVCSKNVADELINRDLIPDYVILTHEHVDHLWGLNDLRDKFPKIKVIAHKCCSAAIGDAKINKAAQYRIYAILRFGESYKNAEAENRKYFCEPADIIFKNKYEFQWQNSRIRVVHTPGHSLGSCLIYINEDMVFSGDTILNEDTFLKFDGGDEELFSKITLPIISTIKPNVKIFPGHAMSFLKREWSRGR